MFGNMLEGMVGEGEGVLFSILPLLPLQFSE